MASVLLAVGDFIASAAISKVKAMVNQYMSDQQEYQTTNVKSRLEELKGYLTQIEAAISAAEKKEVKSNPGLAEWLAELKDAVHDAEDVFDAADYRVLADEAESRTHQSLPQEEKKGKSKGKFLNIKVPNFHKVKKNVGTTAKRLLFHDEELNELIAVVDKLKGLVSNMPRFLQAVLLEHQNASAPTVPNEIPDWRLTTPESVEPKVFGRDTEIKNLVKMIKGTSSSEPESESDEMNYSLLSIVAMRGMGKTTLAQSVFNHKDFDNKFFDVKAWVCVSKNFDTRNVMIQLVEHISEDKGKELRGCRNLITIEKALKECLRGMKFLIVLDDVWDDVETKWEVLSKLFRFGKYGSKVIVTTWDGEVLATVKGKKEIFNLEKLDKNSFWELFKQYAFGTSKPADRYAILDDIGKQIADKLGRSPLGAKVIGRLLNSKLTEKHWNDILKSILKSKLWEVDTKEDGILSVLKLSYDHLPSHLKQCFGYLSLFPQDYVFRKDELIYTWMALGYVHSNEKRPEDVAEDYIDQLTSRCFLQEQHRKYSIRDDDKDTFVYVIHDLLHYLATSIYRNEVHRVEDGSRVIPKSVRHLFVSSGTLESILERVPTIKKLRSLVLMSKELQSLSEEILRKLIKSLRVLILLEIDDTLAERLSQTVSEMIHLRYLGCTLASYIPKFIYKLHHLHAIVFYPGYEDKRILPNGLAKAFNLRYVGANANVSKVSGFGQLTSLQILRYYKVSQIEGRMIDELKNLRQIRGELTIRCIEEVTDEAQAKAAELDNKEHIEDLGLMWSDRSPCYKISEHDEKVLEGLRPHSNLKALRISDYRGAQCPSWLNQTWLSNLENLELYSASFKVLHPLGQFSRLNGLILDDLPLKRFGVEIYGEGETAFPFLKFLILHNFKNLTEWSATKDGQQAFPRLIQAIIEDCPKLSGRLGFLNSPKEFKIEDADSSAELELKTDNMMVLTRNIPHLACIHKLELLRIHHKTTEHEQVFQNLVSLKKLILFHCNLELKDVERALKHLTSLEELKIDLCDDWRQLPKLPLNLKILLIKQCPSLSKRYDWRSYGEEKYWHEISHIPTIKCDGEILGPPALLQS